MQRAIIKTFVTIILYLGKEGGGSCPTPTWKNGYTCQVAGTCSCKDVKGYTDPYGYACSDWNDNCIGASAAWGYTPAEEQSLIRNCPKSCGICTCGPWPGCFGNDSNLILSTKHLRDLRSQNSSVIQNSSVVYTGFGGWFSADLINALFRIFANEILGYKLQVVQASDMDNSIQNLDFLLEVWPTANRSKGIGQEAFELGYNGKEGVYFAGVRYASCPASKPSCKDKCVAHDVAAGRCANRSYAFQVSDSHMAIRALNYFPSLGAFNHMNTSAAPFTRYIPPQCKRPGAPTCMELLHYLDINSLGPPNETHIGRLLAKSEFPYHALFVGSQRTRDGVTHRLSAGLGVVFTWYEPDPFLIKVVASRVAFPYEDSACADPVNGYGMTIGCDKPSQAIKNLVRDSLTKKAPELYYALRDVFRIHEQDLHDMFATHELGGGNATSLNVVACDWMQRHQSQVRGWVAPCIPGTKPYIVDDRSLKCCNGTLLQLRPGAFSCLPHCNLAYEVPDAYAGVCRKRCPTGSVLNRTINSCETCAQSTWTAVSDAMFTGVVAECQCPAGTFQNGPSTTVQPLCGNCTFGTYQDLVGMLQCKECSAGRYQHETGQSECRPCQIGMYTNATRSTMCISCSSYDPRAVTLGFGAESHLKCVCSQNYYHVQGACHRCPEIGFWCPGGHPIFNTVPDTTPMVKKGYMTCSNAPLEVYNCVNGNDRCPQHRSAFNRDLMCPPGFKLDSRQCSSCKDGFYLKDDRCVDCGRAARTSVLIGKTLASFALQFAVITGVHFRESKAEGTGMFTLGGLILEFLQVLAQLHELPLKWPALIDSVLSPLSIFSMEGVLIFNEVEMLCFIAGNEFTKFLLDALVPLLPVFVVCSLYAMARICGKSMDFDNMFNTVCVIHKKLFMTITATTLTLFVSVQMPNGGKWMVREIPGLEYGGRRWNHACPLVVVSFCAYCLSFLAYVTHIVIKGPILAATRPKFLLRNAFAFADFRENRWWWCLVDLSYPLALIGIQVLSSNVHTRVYLSVFVLILVCVLEFLVRPLRIPIHNKVDLILKICLAIFMVLATSFIDLSNMSAEEISNNQQMFAEVGCLTLLAALVFGACSIFLMLAHKIGPSLGCGFLKQINQHRLPLALLFRDVMTQVSMMSDTDFVLAVEDMGDMDALALHYVMEDFVAIFLKQQPHRYVHRQRIMPGVPYEIWHPQETRVEALTAVMSGKAAERLQCTAKMQLHLLKLGDVLRRAQVRDIVGVNALQRRPSTGTISTSDSVERQRGSVSGRVAASLVSNKNLEVDADEFWSVLKGYEEWLDRYDKGKGCPIKKGCEEITQEDVQQAFQFVNVERAPKLPLSRLINELINATPRLDAQRLTKLDNLRLQSLNESLALVQGAARQNPCNSNPDLEFPMQDDSETAFTSRQISPDPYLEPELEPPMQNDNESALTSRQHPCDSDPYFEPPMQNDNESALISENHVSAEHLTRFNSEPHSPEKMLVLI